MQGLGSVLGPAAGGMGILGNIMQMILGNQQLSKVKANENLTPQQLASKVAGATQPLNAGLIQNVGNVVQGQMAERGLAEAPGIFSATESQALAPFYQQNQQTAASLIAQQLGIPEQTLATLMSGGQGANTSALWQMLLSQNNPTNPGAAGQIPGIYGGGGGLGPYGGGGDASAGGPPLITW